LFPHDSLDYALRVSSRVTTEEFERYEPIDEQMDFHEKIRLLYVALTRARDHLVVSVHRTARTPNPAERPRWTHAELIWKAAEDAPRVTELTTTPGVVEPPVTAPAASIAFPAWPDWLERRDAALARGRRSRAHSATA